MILSAFVIGSTGSTGLIGALVFLLIVGICLGILWWLIGTAPFLNVMFKTVLQWLVIAVGCLIVINTLLGITGHALVTW